MPQPGDWIECHGPTPHQPHESQPWLPVGSCSNSCGYRSPRNPSLLWRQRSPDCGTCRTCPGIPNVNLPLPTDTNGFNDPVHRHCRRFHFAEPIEPGRFRACINPISFPRPAVLDSLKLSAPSASLEIMHFPNRSENPGKAPIFMGLNYRDGGRRQRTAIFLIFPRAPDAVLDGH